MIGSYLGRLRKYLVLNTEDVSNTQYGSIAVFIRMQPATWVTDTDWVSSMEALAVRLVATLYAK